MRLRKKNPFEASLVLDKDEVKVVEARYRGNLIFFGIGMAKERTKKVGAGVTLPVTARGAYEEEKEYDWKLFYNPDNMPGFLSMDELRKMAVATTTLTSGSVDAMQAQIAPLPKKEFEHVIKEREVEKYAKKAIKIFEKNP